MDMPTLRRKGSPGRRTLLRRARDRGASAIEWALLTPIMLLIILAVVQFGTYYHAQHVALAAAQAGARVARTYQNTDDGWQGQARDTAMDAVTHFGPNLLEGAAADSDGDAYTRWVVVTGQAPRVLPFLPAGALQVTKRSGGPIECFRPDVDEATACVEQP
jgi:Flp pilus assembly protein TadG